MAREILAPLDEHEIEGFFRTKILPNELLDAVDELHVRENHDLDFEDAGFLGTRMTFSAFLYLLKSRLCFLDRIMEARDLLRYRLIRDNSMRHIRHFPQKKMNWPDDNTGRRRHPDEFHVAGHTVSHYSPNPSAIPSARASRAASGSRPSTLKSIVA